jgi:hypothetical protein
MGCFGLVVNPKEKLITLTLCIAAKSLPPGAIGPMRKRRGMMIKHHAGDPHICRSKVVHIFGRGLVLCFDDALVHRLALRLGKHDRPKVEGHFVELSIKAERRLVIPVVHPGARIQANIERLVDRHNEGDGVRHRLLGDLVVVHLQDASAAFAEAGAVVLEVKRDRVLAR